MYRNGMKGTKWEIFRIAVELFAANTYSSVSIRDITRKVGINPSSLYNHFDSKESLLRAIYGYYRTYYADSFFQLDHILQQVPEKHPHQLLKDCLLVNYPSEIADMMRNVIIVILTQFSSDPEARKVLEDTLIIPAYTKFDAVFQELEKAGKIHPFDHEPFIFTYISISYYTLYYNYLNHSDIAPKWEKAINRLIASVEVIE